MARRVWVVGPIAWDTVLPVPWLPESGGFVQAGAAVERPGGAGANVAIALASAGVQVHMVGYVGKDDFGRALLTQLTDAGVEVSEVRADHPHTSHVQIFVEPDGERTIVGLVPDTLHEVQVPIGRVQEDDLVYIAGWRRQFEPALLTLVERGVAVVTVPPEEPWSAAHATIVLGSVQQFAGTDPAADPRYREALSGGTQAVLLTRGADGVRILTSNGYRDHLARPATMVDATGAGDAFAAGFLLRFDQGLDTAVDTGLAWGARAVETRESQPPPWSAVAGDVTS